MPLLPVVTLPFLQTHHLLPLTRRGAVSLTVPPLSTTMWSALQTVRMRWAMMMAVFPCTSSEIPACIFIPFSASRLAVASSNNNGGIFQKGTAIETRCRSPHERFSPFSLITVSSHCANRAVWRTSLSVEACLSMRYCR